MVLKIAPHRLTGRALLIAGLIHISAATVPETGLAMSTISSDSEHSVSDKPVSDRPGQAGPACGDLSGLSYETLGPIEGEGGCGIEAPLEVSAVDGIALDPPATIDCRTAEALQHWVRSVLTPAADTDLRSPVVRLRIYGSYVCRGRNRNPDAKLSEHALGNAIDVGIIILADGREIAIAPRGGKTTPQANFQKKIRTGACAMFSTVLGPGADDYHDDHLHFDVAKRRNNYKLCQ